MFQTCESATANDLSHMRVVWCIKTRPVTRPSFDPQHDTYECVGWP